MSASPCRSGLPLATGVLLLAALAAGASLGRADELEIGAEADRLVIHDAATILRDHCERDAEGVLWLVLPGGGRHELVTSTADPEIANPGDGAFHPFDPDQVRAAIDEVRFPLTGIAAEIWLLPYPRRGRLDSAAGPGLVLLAPGVRPLSREHQHAELVHELGHIVQYDRFPDHDLERWSAYRAMRGIQDPVVYSATARHADRPHEIFAEDFRALFGGASAVASGSIENPSLAHPSQVPGLRDFLLELADAPRLSLTAHPNPARGRVTFVQLHGASAPLDLFDVLGRRVATGMPRHAGAVTEWRIDLPVLAGGGVLFARPRVAGAPATRVVVLP